MLASSSRQHTHTHQSKPNQLISQHLHSDWLPLTFLLVLSLGLFLPKLGGIGILDPSDGYYSEAAREMLELGNFLTPHLNYQPWFDKPILTYWLIIASYKLFGINEYAARLPSAFCGASLVVYLYWFARHFVCRRAALISSLVLLSSPMFLVIGHLALTDMPLCFLVWMSLGSFFITLSKEKTSISCWLAYLFLGLAVLCKGPVAIILVALSLLTYLLVTTRSLADTKLALKAFKPLQGIILFTAVALPWYLTESIITKGLFFQHFFLQENMSRALGHVDHKQPFWYYFPVILAGFFPWTILMAPIGTTLCRLTAHKQSLSSSQKLAIFSFITAATVFTFYSLLPTKLVTYLLPMLPALALIAGISLDELICLTASSWLKASAIILGLFGVGLTIAAPVVPSYIQQLSSDTLLPILVVAIGFLGSCLLFLTKRTSKAIFALALCTLLAESALVPFGLKTAYDLKCKDFHQVLAMAKRQNMAPLLVGRRSPSAVFYLMRPLRYFGGPNELATFVNGCSTSQIALIDSPCLKSIEPLVGSMEAIAHKGKWYLVRTHAKPAM